MLLIAVHVFFPRGGGGGGGSIGAPDPRCHHDFPGQSHCDENACKCFDYNPAHATGETAGTGTAPADETETGPVVARAVALAPLENFMASGVSTNGGASAFGLLASVATVPAGFVHSSVLVAATGVVRTLHTLGDRLLKKGGKSRTALPHPTDLSLNTLGYWTDKYPPPPPPPTHTHHHHDPIAPPFYYHYHVVVSGGGGRGGS